MRDKWETQYGRTFQAERERDRESSFGLTDLYFECKRVDGKKESRVILC